MQTSKYDKYRILSSLDNPKRVLMFTFPEIMIIFIPFLVGIIIGGIFGLFLMFSGYHLRKVYKRINKLFPQSLWCGMKYWYLPATKNTVLAKSHIREYLL